MTQLISPIHAPCPDMAGCSNFDANTTKASLSKLKVLKDKFFPQSSSTRFTAKGGQDFRFSRAFQVQAKRALMAKGVR